MLETAGYNLLHRIELTVNPSDSMIITLTFDAIKSICVYIYLLMSGLRWCLLVMRKGLTVKLGKPRLLEIFQEF